MENIDLTDWLTQNSPDTGWAPIAAFNGNFDGNFKVISGLWINLPDLNNVGLFGAAQGSISNLGVRLAEEGITGKNSVGILVGTSSGSLTISKCFATGKVSGTGTGDSDRVGGIIGGSSVASTGLTIQNCYFNGDVVTAKSGSGICGYNGGTNIININMTINKCYVAGTISTTKDASGFIAFYGYGGSNSSPNSTITITNNFSISSSISGGTGSVIVRRIHGTVKANITTVINNNYAYDAQKVNGSFISSNNATSQNGADKTAPELLLQETYENVGWDFSDDWILGSGNYQLPVLKGFTLQPSEALAYLPEKLQYPSQGSGISGDPYLIHDAAELNLVRNDASAYYQLANDVDLTDWINTNSPTEGWEPLNAFAGNFDGNNHFITGLWINRSSTNNVGLFGTVTGDAEITQLGVATAVGKTVKGNENVGIIVGKIDGNFTFLNCVALGDAEASKSVGALLGRNEGNITVANSYAAGSITATGDAAGGLIGTSNAASGEINISIQNSYASNTITGTGGAGGLLGTVSGTNKTNLTIENSYAINPEIATTTTVSGSYGRIYGYLKNNSGTLTVNYNYAYEGTLLNGAIVNTGTTTNRNGANKSASQLLTQATYEASAWNFSKTWTMGNDNYPLPVLKKLPASAQPTEYPEHFPPVYTSTGAWTETANWSTHTLPVASDKVVIDADVSLSSDVTVAGLSVNAGKSFIFAAGGQLNGLSDASVAGSVKVVKTFDTGKWYPIGFPFAIESISIKQGENGYTGVIYGLDNDEEVSVKPTNQDNATTENIYLATYDGATDKFKFTDALAVNTGYVIAVPAGTFEVEGTEGGSISEGSVEVTFTTASGVILNSTASDFAVTDGYVLTANPNLVNVSSSLPEANYYYEFNLGNQRFDRIDGGASLSAALKPFEALVTYKGDDSGDALRSALNIDGTGAITGYKDLQALVTDPVIETQYYNLQGVRVRANNYLSLQSGVYIVKKIHKSGVITICKSIIR
jgi:hypothetical protein